MSDAERPEFTRAEKSAAWEWLRRVALTDNNPHAQVAIVEWQAYFNALRDIANDCDTDARRLKFMAVDALTHGDRGPPPQTGDVPLVSPDARSVTLTGPQILDLYEACGGDFTELTSWTVGEREAFVSDDGEQMPAGMYATCAEYPDEGFIGPLGAMSEASQPATVTDAEDAHES